jgi:hypothetical protein
MTDPEVMMWRVSDHDGRLSDIVNLSRAGRRPTDAERVTICALPGAIERALKAAADKGRARDDWTVRT